MFGKSEVESAPRPRQFGLNRMQILQSQHSHRDAESPTVTSGMDYPAAKVPLPAKASHSVRVFCQISFIEEARGLQPAPYLEVTQNNPLIYLKFCLCFPRLIPPKSAPCLSEIECSGNVRLSCSPTVPCVL